MMTNWTKISTSIIIIILTLIASTPIMAYKYNQHNDYYKYQHGNQLYSYALNTTSREKLCIMDPDPVIP